jgi:hypothetical protein
MLYWVVDGMMGWLSNWVVQIGLELVLQLDLKGLYSPYRKTV